MNKCQSHCSSGIQIFVSIPARFFRPQQYMVKNSFFKDISPGFMYQYFFIEIKFSINHSLLLQFMATSKNGKSNSGCIKKILYYILNIFFVSVVLSECLHFVYILWLRKPFFYHSILLVKIKLPPRYAVVFHS